MTTLLNYDSFIPENEDNRKKTPLIILHGLLGSLDNWRSQAKRLSTSRPVYTLDLRNHGKSPHLKGMSYREMYEDVMQVAKHEYINHFHLLGHSMGGKVAMQLALAHPDMIKSLIVVDIAPKPYPLWHQKMFQAIMSVPIETMKTRQDVDEHLQQYLEDKAERFFMLKNIKRKPDGSGVYWQCNLNEISRGYLKIAGFNSALEQYPHETLFIDGAHSNYIQESDTPLIKSIFPQASISTLDESGHLPHIQQADDFYKLVIDFLSNS